MAELAERLRAALADRYATERLLRAITTTAQLTDPYIQPMFDGGRIPAPPHARAAR